MQMVVPVCHKKLAPSLVEKVQFNCKSNSLEIDLVYLHCTEYYQRVLYAHPEAMEANESKTEIVTIQHKW